MKAPLFLLALAAALVSRAAAEDAPKQFDPAGSDPQAVAAVDRMYQGMQMPGAWGKAHYIEFGFGSSRHDTVTVFRHHAWDTWTNRYRVEGSSRRTGKKFLILFDDVNNPATAHVWLDGQAQTADSTVKQYGEAGHGMFINDSYWLLMPYKLKDPGVHLHWLGADKDSAGKELSKIDVSFDNVGLTPKDHYTVWIDNGANRVYRWIYHSGEDSTQTSDNMFMDYEAKGPLMVSMKRPRPGGTDGVVFADVHVSDAVDESKFKAP